MARRRSRGVDRGDERRAEVAMTARQWAALKRLVEILTPRERARLVEALGHAQQDVERVARRAPSGPRRIVERRARDLRAARDFVLETGRAA
jgi:hypothetical protein